MGSLRWTIDSHKVPKDAFLKMKSSQYANTSRPWFGSNSCTKIRTNWFLSVEDNTNKISSMFVFTKESRWSGNLKNRDQFWHSSVLNFAVFLRYLAGILSSRIKNSKFYLWWLLKTLALNKHWSSSSKANEDSPEIADFVNESGNSFGSHSDFNLTFSSTIYVRISNSNNQFARNSVVKIL